MSGETVTRIRTPDTGTLDRYNRPVPGEPVESDLDGAAFDPGGNREPVDVGRQPVVTTPKLYFRTTVDLTADDRVRVRGLLYDVEGDPALWVSPTTGTTAGTVVELKRVEG